MFSAEYTPAGSSRDRARSAIILAGAAAQAVLPLVLVRRFRFEEAPPDVIQPAAWGFLIWLPIYATCLGYAADQLRTGAQERQVPRQVGGSLAAAFASNAAWAPLVVRRHYWAAQAALLGTATFSGVARHRLSRAEASGVGFTTAERRALLPGVGMLAGWSAAATGINLAAMLVGRGPVPPGRPATVVGGALLLGLGGLGGATLPAGTPEGRTSRAYAATLLWAFAGVVDGRRAASPALARVAAVSAAPVVAAALRGIGRPTRAPGRRRTFPVRPAGAGRPGPRR